MSDYKVMIGDCIESMRQHEQIFLFTKRDRYNFDGDAVRVEAEGGGDKLRGSLSMSGAMV
jgi:hypothetical protein